MTVPEISEAERLLSALSRLARGAPAPGGVLVDLTLDGGVRPGLVPGPGQHLAVRDAAVAGTGDADGTEVIRSDPSDPGAVAGHLADALGGRPVSGVCIGDALNRVGDLERYLSGLRALCERVGGAPLLLVSPNVTHLDVAAKLLLGRWDVTPTGTLCAAYVRHFSDRSLRETMATHGWQETGAEDLTSDDSDQHFPADAAPLERTTPIGALLCRLRETAAPGAHVDLLVRAYVPSVGPGGLRGSPRPSEPAEITAGGRLAPAPFLSVLLRTQGRRHATLQEALLCLAAQTCDDFEVLVLLHDADEAGAASVRSLVASFHDSFSSRVRILDITGGGRCRPLNDGAVKALGQYVAMLDDDDLVLANWVETFHDTARRFPGHVVRTAVATQRIVARDGEWDGEDGYEVVDRPRLVFALDFDYVDHILDNRTPTNGYAFPRSLVTELGLRWDESLPVLEDWDHLLWSASACGVAGVPAITSLLRAWDVGEDSKSQHTPALWEATRRRVIAKHDSSPLLLDCGTFSQLRTRLIDGDVAAEYVVRLEEDVLRLSAELEAAQGRLGQMHESLEAMTIARGAAVAALQAVRSSRSWRVTAGLRLAAGVARKAARRSSRLRS